jgi:SOS-response transcriptional repressor LexA
MLARQILFLIIANMPALPLSPTQLEDARRLKAIYESKKAELGLTQESLAAACGWESQGSVSQYLNGKIPLNIDAAVKFARELRVSVADFSPELDRELTDLYIAYTAIPETILGKTNSNAAVIPFASRHDLIRFDVLDVVAACGPGAVNSDYPEVIHSIEMPVDVARRLIERTNGDIVKIIRATHDSMTPTIQPDDLLFVDTSARTFNGEGVYLLLHGGELICKRLTYVGRTLTVVSDNTHYPSWAWDEKLDDTQIVGKVLRALPMDMKNFGS